MLKELIMIQLHLNWTNRLSTEIQQNNTFLMIVCELNQWCYTLTSDGSSYSSSLASSFFRFWLNAGNEPGGSEVDINSFGSGLPPKSDQNITIILQPYLRDNIGLITYAVVGGIDVVECYDRYNDTNSSWNSVYGIVHKVCVHFSALAVDIQS